MSASPGKVLVLGDGAEVPVLLAGLHAAHLPATRSENADDVRLLLIANGGDESAARLAPSWPTIPMLLVGARTAERIQALHARLGAARQRLMAAGTTAASARLARGIAARLRVAVEHVHAWIVGTTDRPIPLWSSATVAGVPLSEWRVMGHGRLTVPDRVELLHDALRDAGEMEQTVPLVARAVLLDQNRVLCVGSRIEGIDPSIEGAVLGWPTIVSARGGDALLPVRLNDAERAALGNR